jgi:hypothetical protein
MSEKSAPGHAALYLRFKLQVPPSVLAAQSRQAAPIVASVKGLIWKIWVVREDEFEMGGMYLFANRESAEAYLNHPVIQALCCSPAVVSTQSEVWDVDSFLSAVTRAPLQEIHQQNSEAAAMAAGGR